MVICGKKGESQCYKTFTKSFDAIEILQLNTVFCFELRIKVDLCK